MSLNVSCDSMCACIHVCMCVCVFMCVHVRCPCPLQGDDLSRLQKEWTEEKLQLTSHSSKLQAELAGKESELNMAAERLIQVREGMPACLCSTGLHLRRFVRGALCAMIVNYVFAKYYVRVSTLQK